MSAKLIKSDEKTPSSRRRRMGSSLSRAAQEPQDEEERQRRAAAEALRPSQSPCVLADEPQTPSLISTKEISLGRRWDDKRPQRAFCRLERKPRR